MILLYLLVLMFGTTYPAITLFNYFNFIFRYEFCTSIFLIECSKYLQYFWFSICLCSIFIVFFLLIVRTCKVFLLHLFFATNPFRWNFLGGWVVPERKQSEERISAVASYRLQGVLGLSKTGCAIRGRSIIYLSLKTC